MIQSTDAIQGGPQLADPPEPAAGTSLPAPPSVQIIPENPGPPVEDESASRAEKRRRLAQIIRVNLLDCFDDSGAFDLAHAQRVLPPGAVQHLVVHETTRTDKHGNTTVQRRITLRLVDKIRAMRLDDALEDKQEKAVESAALKKVAHLEKALTDADNRELQHSRDTEEKDRQIEALRSARQQAQTTVEDPEQCRRAAAEPAGDPESKTLSAVEGPAPNSPAQIEAQRRKSQDIAIQSKIREVEHLKNTSGHLAFSSTYPQWPQDAAARRAYALRLIKAEAGAAERQKIADARRAADRELDERNCPPRKRSPIHAFNF